MSLIGVWTNEATKALLSIWGGEVVQNQLRELKRNRSVFEKIAEDMSDLGIEFTWKQCRTKVKNLSQFYRKVWFYYFLLVCDVACCVALLVCRLLKKVKVWKKRSRVALFLKSWIIFLIQGRTHNHLCFNPCQTL